MVLLLCFINKISINQILLTRIDLMKKGFHFIFKTQIILSQLIKNNYIIFWTVIKDNILISLSLKINF